MKINTESAITKLIWACYSDPEYAENFALWNLARQAAKELGTDGQTITRAMNKKRQQRRRATI